MTPSPFANKATPTVALPLITMSSANQDGASWRHGSAIENSTTRRSNEHHGPPGLVEGPFTDYINELRVKRSLGLEDMRALPRKGRQTGHMAHVVGRCAS